MSMCRSVPGEKELVTGIFTLRSIISGALGFNFYGRQLRPTCGIRQRYTEDLAGLNGASRSLALGTVHPDISGLT